MKLTIIRTALGAVFKKALPYLLALVVGGVGVGYWYNLKTSVASLQWELVTEKNRTSSLAYELEKEREWQAKEREWQLQMNQRFEELNTEVSSYTKQLKEIENERSEAGISNSLSDDVTRVLKSFNNHQD